MGDLARAQRKADADVEQVKARRTRNADRLEQGLVSDPKQMQALQHELETLGRRISDLEDEELVVMEELEDAQARLAVLTAELAEIDDEGARAQQARDASGGEIAQLQSDSRAERDQLAAEVPPALLTLYDKLRSQLGGVGVGALQHRRCGGCRLDVGAADLARIANAPSDEVIRCEECNRILVRTSESGL